MIRTTIIVEGYKVDLLKDIATDFTYSVQDIREPDKRNTDYSKTIELPGTAYNNSLFAHILEVNIENDFNAALANIGYNFNPNKVAKTVVLVDGVEVFRGVMQLTKVRSDRGVVIYETNVTGRLADILYSMGDKKLADIPFSNLNHILTVDHLQNVWNNPDSFRYAYPLIDYGMSKTGVSYPLNNFAPAIYVKEYIDRIFAQAGFTYNSRFFNTPYFKSLIIPPTENREFTTSGEKTKFMRLYSRYESQSNKRTGNNWREVTVPFVNVDYDKYRWHSGDNHHIIITNRLESSFQFSLNFRHHNTRGRGCEIFVLKNGNRILTQQVDSRFEFREEVIEVPRQLWEVGDTIQLAFNMPPKSTVTWETSSTWLAPSPVDQSQYPIDGNAEIDMAQLVSKSVTQRDFFKSIILMHNLFVFTDENDERNLFVTPQMWFYSTYAVDAVDWTCKVDYSKPIDITPMGLLTAREYSFTYKKDNDYWGNDWYFTRYNETYGQRTYVVDNDFQKSTQKIELIFSPTVSVQEEGSRRVIPHIYKKDKEGSRQRDAFNIRILQYGGLLDSLDDSGRPYARWEIVDTFNNVLGQFVQYPYAGMTDHPTSPTRDICFSPPRELKYQVDNPYPNVGLYRYYWESYLKEITNKDSKLVALFVYLLPMDISRLDFKRLVKVNNVYYKLNKVPGYDPLNEGSTQVELFKTAVKVSIEKPGFLLHGNDGYLLHDDTSPARIPYA
ncbi:hypothetical protein KTO58_01230 [Chitinophaga pendula]|uniref:hypothetical protein n=1 Tax=Chitinophaga TaxID=79328 RepID=UPI000BAF0C5E|nr:MULTISPECIES: hypothetical protein [Chitinophaga]ASZ14515.1 hypothetical protein CK934_27990 [Chitinophaga sp. MD30]UCJ07828.1 hypothetical protein KTO58_01230 [Chitinophaga pendula]